MEEEKRKAYSEVVEILKLIEDEKRMEKIPFEVIELIKNNSDPEYKPNISKEIPLEEQNLKRETYSIMAWIASKYWNEDVKIQSENSVENQNEVRKDGGVYNDIEPTILEAAMLPAVIEEKWYIKVKESVIRLLKIIFKFRKNKEEVSE